MKYCSISKRFLVVNSSDSNVGHLKIGVIEQSDISHLNWLKWLATEVFLLLRISNRWLWNLCLRERFVWPMYCKPQLSHSIKYIKLFELQLMLVCILKVWLVAMLTISERGSKYSQVGQNGRSHCVEEALMLGSSVSPSLSVQYWFYWIKQVDPSPSQPWVGSKGSDWLAFSKQDQLCNKVLWIE